MLIDFEVENFRSYRLPRKLSLVASKSSENPQNLREIPELRLTLVRSAAVYGPNASGKSNLIAAMHFLGELIDLPMNRSLSGGSGLQPFALDQMSATKPTRFRCRFIVLDIAYEYEINIRPNIVESERLVAYPQGRPQEWFFRTGDEIKFNSTHLLGPKRTLMKVTRPDSPFLAVAAAFGNEQLFPIGQWLSTNLRTSFDSFNLKSRPRSFRSTSSSYTAHLFEMDEAFRDWATAFVRHADLGIEAIEVDISEEKVFLPTRQRGEDGEIVRPVREEKHKLYHPIFVHPGEGGLKAKFALSDESLGTQRLFSMLASLYTVLQLGRVVVIDELSASMHPHMVLELIRLFHTDSTNRKNSQLIFASHDTSLLSAKNFRRDQVWFVEKDQFGASDLYSLHDVKGVREGESFQNGYLRGRYGAIPFYGNFDFPPIPENSPEAIGQQEWPFLD